ncbi:tripartite tricarboxylate transporter TctB family protein [Cohaesibacter celericrescens]|uniref:Tripartite tricarboxylate transporter TctB family protein n=1 Tax=Cohaesibacter celericrescens TaxID=2067669 RepID=A0A2N5XST3_9HYPH|nr:tripartite tricarboxylate transporter TctB family protein [Cohaesibacter celericrescens]PLW77520.1 tripartite tricarboxylate transporter TctB family protein [Cohaesibacter celericrescens]
MDREFRGDQDHHNWMSDAVPGGYALQQRPGETVFALLLLAASLFLLYSAFGISGFEALSAPGSVPMATTFVMVVSAAYIVYRTLPQPVVKTESIRRHILPTVVVLFFGFLIAFGILLKPLGFLPTAALFLVIAIKVLSRRSWIFSFSVGLGSLLVVWLLFRIVFTVLLPSGIVPEAEFIQLFRELFAGVLA